MLRGGESVGVAVPAAPPLTSVRGEEDEPAAVGSSQRLALRAEERQCSREQQRRRQHRPEELEPVTPQHKHSHLKFSHSSL